MSCKRGNRVTRTWIVRRDGYKIRRRARKLKRRERQARRFARTMSPPDRATWIEAWLDIYGDARAIAATAGGE